MADQTKPTPLPTFEPLSIDLDTQWRRPVPGRHELPAPPADVPPPPDYLRFLFGDTIASALRGLDERIRADPDIAAGLADREAARQAAASAPGGLGSRVSGLVSGVADRMQIPDPVRQQLLGDVGRTFTPIEAARPHLQAMRDTLAARTSHPDPVVAAGLGLERLLGTAAINQLEGASSPGGALLTAADWADATPTNMAANLALTLDPNLVQQLAGGEGAGGATAAALAGSDDQSGDGANLAAIAPITLGGRRPVLDLARTLKYLGDARYALRRPIVERLADLYERGVALPYKASWGGTEHPELLAAFGGDPDLAQQWARFFGTTSAGTSVPKNTQESIAALTHALDRPGMPFEATEMVADKAGRLRPRLALYDTIITNAEAKLPSLNRALAGLDPSGPKTEAMAQFMWGQPRSPIDRHILWGLGSADDTLSEQHAGLKAYMQAREGMRGTGRDQLNERKVYRRYEQALADALQGLDPKRPYNPLFGDLWEGARIAKGETYQGGPIDILRARDLLGPGFLTDPERLKYVLADTSGLWVAPPPSPKSFLDLGR